MVWDVRGWRWWVASVASRTWKEGAFGHEVSIKSRWVHAVQVGVTGTSSCSASLSLSAMPATPVRRRDLPRDALSLSPIPSNSSCR